MIVTPSRLEGQRTEGVRRMGTAGAAVGKGVATSATKRGVVQLGVALTHCSFVLGAILLKTSMKHIDPTKHEVFHPIVYAFFREISAAPVLFLLSVATLGYRLPQRGDAVKVFGLGLCMFLSQLLYIMGVDMAGVLMASCIQPSVPVFTVMLALFLGSETGSARKMVGILLAVLGAMCMVVGSIHDAKDGASGVGTSPYLGDVCILVNAIAMAVYYLLAKKLVAKYSAIHVATWAYTVAATLMGMAAMVWTRPTDWVFPKAMVGPLVYWIFVCSVGGYLVVTYAMNHLPASQVASFQCLQPFVGAALAVMVLGERVNTYDLGAFGIVIGLLMVTRGGG